MKRRELQLQQEQELEQQQEQDRGRSALSGRALTDSEPAAPAPTGATQAGGKPRQEEGPASQPGTSCFGGDWLFAGLGGRRRG